MLAFICKSLCLMLLACPSLLQADDASLESLITSIQQQESHYGELDYVISWRFERSQAEGLNDDLGTSDILVSDWRAQLSLRNDRWVYEASQLAHYLLSDSQWTYSGLWNGDAFYLLGEVVETDAASGAETARYSRGQVLEHPRDIAYPVDFGWARFHRPHTTINELCSVHGVPLSVWLGGREAIEAAGFEAFEEVTVQDFGETDWQGLACHHLRVEIQRLESSDEIPNVDIEIWLAKDRNLIPVHAVLYRHVGEQRFPCAQLTITDWHEITPGVFFPKNLHDENYDNELVEGAGRFVVRDRTNWTVESVSTNSSRPNEDFESFSFPEGVEVIRR